MKPVIHKLNLGTGSLNLCGSGHPLVQNADTCVVQWKRVTCKRCLKSKLKPCPFCGHKAELREEIQDGWVCIKCMGCPMITDYYLNESKASDVWNRRVPVQKKAKK